MRVNIQKRNPNIKVIKKLIKSNKSALDLSKHEAIQDCIEQAPDLAYDLHLPSVNPYSTFKNEPNEKESKFKKLNKSTLDKLNSSYASDD